MLGLTRMVGGDSMPVFSMSFVPLGLTAEKVVDDHGLDEALAADGVEMADSVPHEEEGRVVVADLVAKDADRELVVVGARSSPRT